MSKKINLEITWVKIADLTAYKGNTKKHSPHQIQQIADSITEFGMNDPIGVWHHDGKTIVVEGHGRLQACLKLGYEEVPIISLDHLNDEQRRAYGIIHNKLTMDTDFDLDLLESELLDLAPDIDLSEYDLHVTMADEASQGDWADAMSKIPDGESDNEDCVTQLRFSTKANKQAFLEKLATNKSDDEQLGDTAARMLRA